MTDQNSQFFAILTAVGEAKQANANALGVPWTFAQMGVGDANNTDPVPSRTQTKLINERRRAALNQIKVDPTNPSIIIAEQVIPPEVGGWWIREIGLYDAAGDLVAVANCAPSFKPLLSQGTGKTQVVRLNIVVTSTANVELKIDPAVVLATREYVDSLIVNVLPANKTPGTYTQVRVNERGIVQQGYNPTTLQGYGITNGLRVGEVSNQRPVLSGAKVGDGLEGGALEIREAQGVGNSNTSFAYAPRILFNWSGVASGFLAMNSQGRLAFAGKNVMLAGEATTLAGYGITDAYTQSQTNTAIASGLTALRGGVGSAYDTLQKIALDLVKKPDRATTLEGYGITDAMPKGAGGLATTAAVVQGASADLTDTQFISVTNNATTDRPGSISYGTGFHIKYPGEKYAFEMLAGMTNEWFGVRAIGASAAGEWRQLWHSGNFTPANYATKATTLAGYGIADAYNKTDTKSLIDQAVLPLARKDQMLVLGGNVSRQQPVLASPTTGTSTGTYASAALILREALEVGGSETREMFAPGIGFHWYGNIAGKLVMDAVGKLKWNGAPLLIGEVATQPEVDNGSSDSNVVTPAKMRWGFTFLRGGGGASNAVVFPTWLGSLMIQWGVHVANAADGETNVNFPLGFNIIPACVSTFTHDGAYTQSTVTSQARQLSATGFQSRREDIVNTSSFSATAYIRWIAIGY